MRLKNKLETNTYLNKFFDCEETRPQGKTSKDNNQKIIGERDWSRSREMCARLKLSTIYRAHTSAVRKTRFNIFAQYKYSSIVKFTLLVTLFFKKFKVMTIVVYTNRTYVYLFTIRYLFHLPFQGFCTQSLVSLIFKIVVNCNKHFHVMAPKVSKRGASDDSSSDSGPDDVSFLFLHLEINDSIFYN